MANHITPHRWLVAFVIICSCLFVTGCNTSSAGNEQSTTTPKATVSAETPNKPVAPTKPHWHSPIESQITSTLGANNSHYTVFVAYPKSGTSAYTYQSRPMRSASMIKVFILEKLMADVDANKISLDEQITLHGADKVGGAGVIAGWPNGSSIPLGELARLMIAESDNTATNLIIQRLSMTAINDYIKAHGYKDTVLARKMMDTQAAAEGRENMTSVADLGLFFTRLYNGEGMSPTAKQFMMDCLLAQTDKECFPSALPEAQIAHKTGELDGLYDDGGIITENGETMIVCIMDDDINRYQAIANMKKLVLDFSEEITKVK